MNAVGCGQHTMPASRHARARPSSSTDSRRISPRAAPKITIVPATLPSIGCPPRQSGSATSTPATGGAATITAIQNQLRPSIPDGTRSIEPWSIVGRTKGRASPMPRVNRQRLSQRLYQLAAVITVLASGVLAGSRRSAAAGQAVTADRTQTLERAINHELSRRGGVGATVAIVENGRPLLAK